MKEKKEFEEYKMKLIWLDKDIICTSGDGLSSGTTTDPMPDEDGGFEGPEGPDIFD